MDYLIKNIGMLGAVAVVIFVASIAVGRRMKKIGNAGGDLNDKRRAATKIFKYCCAISASSLMLAIGTLWTESVNHILVLGFTYVMFRYSEKALDAYIDEYQ